MVGRGDRRPKIGGLIELHEKHRSEVEAALIGAGLRWRDAGGPQCTWSDIYAVLTTQPWDSPLAKALEPENWYWYGPLTPVLIETRDYLRQLAYKTPLQDLKHKAGMPKMTVPPWGKDETVEKFSPEPSTEDDVLAHIEALNGART